MVLRLRITLLCLLFALMFINTGVLVYSYLHYIKISSSAGWQYEQQGNRIFITDVDNNGPAASILQRGDEIVTLNGQPAEKLTSAQLEFYGIKPGPYKITIRRDGETHDFSLQTGPFSFDIPWLQITLGLPLILLFTGLIVFLLRPDHKQAFLFALMMLTFPKGWIPGYLIANLPWWAGGIVIVADSVTEQFLPVFLHFFLIFPERSPLVRRFPRLEWYLYLPYVVTWPFGLASTILDSYAPEKNVVLHETFYFLGPILKVLILTYLFGGVLVFVVNYRRADSMSRRKLRVVLAGIIAGLLPVILWMLTDVAASIFNLPQSNMLLWWLFVIGSFALALIPIAFAYAIVRHRVIPVRLIIRLGVQYLLAKNALRILLALPIIGLVLTIVLNPNRTLPEILFRNSVYFYLLIITAVTTSLVYRNRLSAWVDRKFFRETYNQETILRKAIDEVKRLDSMAETVRQVGNQLESALHPKQIYLFYSNEEAHDLSLGYATGGIPQELKIPDEASLVHLFENQAGPLIFPLAVKDRLPPNEQEWLSLLGTNLIVPVRGINGHLIGLFLLGEKKSETPYTARDRELLETLADQFAIVYENVKLKRRVDREEKIKREVLARFEAQNINLLKECPACGACFDSTMQVCPKDHSELTLPLAVERTVEGRYRLEQLIGKGGMGSVYEAIDLQLSRKVAIKILSSSMFGNRIALRRFEREAQTSAKLRHRNIITVYDYGVLKTGGAFLVMELVQGEALREVIDREGHIAPRIVAELLDQVLEGIKAAHKEQIVHRDLKPENILISKDEHSQTLVKIVDFGLAKIRTDEADNPYQPTLSTPATTPGTIMGTFGYMSPEQLTGANVDERSDFFSIGVIAVESLTGRRPFNGRTYPELLTSILHGSFHLKGDAKDILILDSILNKCLAKDPNERFSSAAEMQKGIVPAIYNCDSFPLELVTG
jgi:eukaryotic-like serine/threonine-protein kinase